MTVREIVNEIKLIEAEIKRRYDECRIDRYNTGDIQHLKQVKFRKCDKKTGGYLVGIGVAKRSVGL